MCIMILEYEEGVFLYSLEEVGLVWYFWKAPMQPTSPCIDCTARRRWGQEELGAVRPHPRLRAWPPPLAIGVLARPRPLLCWCLALIWRLDGFWLYFAWMRLLGCAFLYVFMCCPAKYLNTKTCGECELKTLFLSFGILYLFILFKMLVVKIWVKHRQQAPPHLVLCSSSSKVQWTKRVDLLDLKICIQVILSITWTCELPSVYQNILANWKTE